MLGKPQRSEIDLEMRKVLIADASEEFRMALADVLRGTYIVRSCQEGNQTLEALHHMRPDILVLDMLLPGIDGISLLQKAADAGLQPMVLATTGFVNEYVLECAERMGVGYVMVKPCDVYATAARIADLQQHLQPSAVSRPDLRTVVSNLLLTLNVPTKLKGYACLREAILESVRDPSQQVTKELYPKVAKICDGNAVQVERSIRSAIAAAWERRDEQLWRMYFRPNQQGHLERPTNAAFISGLAARVAMSRGAER